MEARELRIGNLVHYNGSHKEAGVVCGVRKLPFSKNGYQVFLNDRIDIPYESVEPIPLTEDWLLKLGFIQGKTFFGIELTNGMFLCYRDKNIILEATNNIKILRFDGCKYVHKLQNLYFGLTGSELSVKQTTEV